VSPGAVPESPTAADIAQTRAVVERVLEELGLAAFLFTLEPKESGWQLTVECAGDGGWQTITLPADAGELRASVRDPEARDRLRTAWSNRLGGCTRGSTAS
jgi:hypothetical protein